MSKKCKELTVYIITKHNKVIAITEEYTDAIGWFIQNNMYGPVYNLHKLHGDTAEECLILYTDDLYLENYGKYIIRYCDKNPISELLYEFYTNVNDSIETVLDATRYININNKHTLDAMNILTKIRKKIKTSIDVTMIVNDYYSGLDFRKDNTFYDPMC